jgi:hypothetical protein
LAPVPPSFWRRNGLSLAFGGLTLASLVGHVLTGRAAENHERLQQGLSGLDVWQYVRSGVFTSSLFENWESEFLQMALFVLLTVGLRQKGSSESKPVEDQSQEDVTSSSNDAPWPVRSGGVWLKLYEHSLSLVLIALFAIAFVAHWCGSYQNHVEKAAKSGQPIDHDLWRHLIDSEFWFESFQNWQSEFFSISVLVLLSIYLREKGSSQSKEVTAAHSETGN